MLAEEGIDPVALAGAQPKVPKNLSVGHDVTGEWRVTPAYDLPSSDPYGDTTMALPVQGRRREDITRTTLVEMAAAIDLRRRAAVAVIDQLAEAVSRWLPDLDDLPFDERRIHKLRRLVLDRRDKLAGRA